MNIQKYEIMRKTLKSLGCIIVAMVLFSLGSAEAADVKLAWDPSSPAPNGYRVYYGTASGSYSSNVDSGAATRHGDKPERCQ